MLTVAQLYHGRAAHHVERKHRHRADAVWVRRILEEWLAQENPQGRVAQVLGYNATEQGRVAKSEYAIAKRVAFGFSADEARRITRANEYDSFTRESFYPLLNWNWPETIVLNFCVGNST